MKKSSPPTSREISEMIYHLRGHRVMLDADLAKLYGVSTKRLNEQVRRNRKRFPEDFMFQLSKQELNNWRSQIATSNPSVKMGLRRCPYAFTEHGAVMLAAVLNSQIAVNMSIQVVRAFIKAKELVAKHTELAVRIEQLEQKFGKHDEEIGAIFEAIKRLMFPPEIRKGRRIGFASEAE